MKTTTYVMTALLTLFLFTSCYTPLPISKLTPVAEKSSWHFGKEVVHKTKNDIEVSLSFVKNYADDLIFDVEVINHSGNTVLVAPGAFYYIALNNNNREITKRYAADPEKVLLNIDKKLSRENANKANQSVLHSIEIATEIAEDIATINQESTPGEDIEREISENDRREADIDIENTIYSLNDRRGYWESQTLRKTSVPSKYSIHGNVFFNRHTEANFYRVYIKIDGTTFRFDYRQELIKP